VEEEEEEEIVPLDRYFYYMSVCIGQDANMEVTGYGGSGAKGGRTRAEREQAAEDAKNATKEMVEEGGNENVDDVEDEVNDVVMQDAETGE